MSVKNKHNTNKKNTGNNKSSHILTDGALDHYFQQLHKGWKLVGERKIIREYLFKNYKNSLQFTYRVGQLAEELDHHPEILLSWGTVKVTVQTHEVDGLTEMDFLLGTQIDKIFYSHLNH